MTREEIKEQKKLERRFFWAQSWRRFWNESGEYMSVFALFFGISVVHGAVQGTSAFNAGISFENALNVGLGALKEAAMVPITLVGGSIGMFGSLSLLKQRRRKKRMLRLFHAVRQTRAREAQALRENKMLSPSRAAECRRTAERAELTAAQIAPVLEVASKRTGGVDSGTIVTMVHRHRSFDIELVRSRNPRS